MSGENPSPYDAFVERLWKDVDANDVRPLAEYLAQFPGDDVRIARDYARVVGGEAADGRAAAAPTSDEPGRRFGPYRILSELGRGGQGAVFLAEDVRVRRQVALKVLTESSQLSPSALERFRREALIASKLDHPGICPVYDVGLEGGAPYLAMKLVRGETLARRIATARERRSQGAAAAGSGSQHLVLPDTKADPPTAAGAAKTKVSPPTARAEIFRIVGLVERAARAVHAAHEAGVIHRDLKPGNIMVSEDGEPTVLDFGLAQETAGDAPTLTQTGDVMGTPAYMSPEQVKGQLNRLDRRTDVYSLGVTLFECLTLHRPFDAPTRAGLYEAILTKEAPDVRRLNPALPDDLRVVVATALEKDRDGRYATAFDFAEDLRRVRQSEPIKARPAGPLLRLNRWTRRNPALAAALFGLFVALAAGLALTSYWLQRATVESAAKAAALDDYDRLGDVPRLARLVEESEELWPAAPEKIPRMRRWLDEASQLKRNLPAHIRVRDSMRSATGLLPYSDEDRASDRTRLSHHEARRQELVVQRDAATRTLSRLAKIVDGDPATRPEGLPTAEEMRALVAEADSEIPRLEQLIGQRLTWRFASAAAQFKHDTFARLVDDMTAFTDPTPFRATVMSVERRLAFASSVEYETLVKHASRWETALTSIAERAECPKYDGLRIARQLGLIPIRRDPQSGLWEFAHLQTTQPGVDPIPSLRPDGRYELTDGTGLIFVLIPGGTFTMGARPPTPLEANVAEDGFPLPPNVDPLAEPRETLREMSIAPFFLSKYEMTQGQWQRLTGDNPAYYRPGGRAWGEKVVSLRHPVEQVSFQDCAGSRGWIARLGLRLPNEAQWEYACRAATTTPWWTGARKESLASAANLADQHSRSFGGLDDWLYEEWNDGYTAHAPVGTFASNGFGLHDTLGNVTEWCRNRYADNDDLRIGTGNPLQDAGENEPWVVIRGGCYSDNSNSARSARRRHTAALTRQNNLGLRPCREIAP